MRVVMVIALLIRLGVFLWMPDQDFPDARAYLEDAHSLIATGFLGQDNHMPLYPLLVAALGMTGVRLFDIVLSVGLVGLVHALSLTLFQNRTAALLAAVATAIHPYFIFYAGSGLTETSYLFLLTAAILCFYRERDVLGGILFVLAILERPTLEFLGPVLVVVFAVGVHRKSWRQAGVALARYGLIYGVLMAPWWIHNEMKYGRFVRLNLGDGVVLYSGNNPLNRSGGGVAYGNADDDMDLSRFASIVDPIARNDAMKQAAIDYIRAEPAHFVAMMGVKFLRLWRLWPYAAQYQGLAPVVLSLAGYGVILVLALVFLVRHGWALARTLLPLYLVAGAVTLVHVITIASIRYRLPLEPLLIVLAGFTAAEALRRVMDRSR